MHIKKSQKSISSKEFICNNAGILKLNENKSFVFDLSVIMDTQRDFLKLSVDVMQPNKLLLFTVYWY